MRQTEYTAKDGEDWTEEEVKAEEEKREKNFKVI